MNRANFGNITTNASQTLAVSGFTASGYLSGERRRRLADAASALNNMSEDEVRALGMARAESARQETRRVENKVDPLSRLTNEEQSKYGEARAEKLREFFSDKDDESIDDLLADTPQASEIKTNINNNIKLIGDWVERGAIEWSEKKTGGGK